MPSLTSLAPYIYLSARANLAAEVAKANAVFEYERASAFQSALLFANAFSSLVGAV